MQGESQVPVIDVSPLIDNTPQRMDTALQLKRACTESGFFYISNHGVDEHLQAELEALSKQFFALPRREKMKIRMELGGRAWRGYFPVGQELTSGKPDLKEGIYFGEELSKDDSRVQQEWPLHGPNLFPPQIPKFAKVIPAYLSAMTHLGQLLMEGIALSLSLPDDYFRTRYTEDPTVLFRIFHYPSPRNRPDLDAPWGVGEHTDYGVLTILKQDATGGLQVKSQNQWIEAPYIPGTFICNIGDMLDRMTGGYYRSTPHRVRNTTDLDRLSYPFFFDPNFSATIHPIDLAGARLPADDGQGRWDGASVHEFAGTYGDYLLGKVAKVFPDLFGGQGL